MILVFFFSPPDPPTHEFFSPVRNPPRIPTPFPAYIVIIIIILIFFSCSLSLSLSLSLLSRMNSTRSRRSRIADRRTFFRFSFLFFFRHPRAARQPRISRSLDSHVRQCFLFFSFLFFSFPSNRVLEPAILDRGTKISNPEFVRSFVRSFVRTNRSIDRSVDRSLVAAMANTDELSVVKFSFHYV